MNNTHLEHGCCEEDICGRNGCEGTIVKDTNTQGCRCHISPPCSYCHCEVQCNECDWASRNENLQEQSKPTEQCLISGADALRALADGKDVENWNGSVWWDVDKTWQVGAFMADRKFRLKPRTITLNVEIPAPFEPKDGEIYYFINSSNLKGYGFNKFSNDGDDECLTFYGAWRTEEEIKQVVAALRGGIKG